MNSLFQKKDSLCFVAMGGNRSNTIPVFFQALFLLKKLDITHLKLSRLFLTSPIGIASHQLFFNCCLSFRTTLFPISLLEEMQKIEKILQKEKKEDGSRTIDLDLIFYEKISIKTKNLTLPHPEWSKRLFVTKPLNDLIKEIDLDIPFNIEALVLSLQKEQNSFCEAITKGAFDEDLIQRETRSDFWSLCSRGRGRGAFCRPISV